MSWTYTNDPSNVTLDELRLLIGDIDCDNPQLTDQELTYFLTSEGSVTGAAIRAAEGLAAYYAGQVDQAVGDLQISYSQKKDGYLALIKQLKQRRLLRTAGPVVGGISQSRKETVEADTDRVAPAFRRDQFRNDEADDELISNG